MRVKFPAYRRYHDARVAANDAMMALLIGARLGDHLLRTSPADPAARLPELFGRIPGIERVNRTVGDAARLLEGSERHLAYMGIPYALGVQGAYLAETVVMLRADGKDDQTTTWNSPWRADPTEIPLWEIHEYVAERCEQSLSGELLELFHLSRRIRNRIIHFGGDAGSRLPGEYRSLPVAAKASWERITHRALPVAEDKRLDLADGELIAVLAITRHLAAEINEMLANRLSRSYWARLAVEDYRAVAPDRFRHRAQRTRRVLGFARTFYAPLALTSEEIEVALGKT